MKRETHIHTPSIDHNGERESMCTLFQPFNHWSMIYGSYFIVSTYIPYDMYEYIYIQLWCKIYLYMGVVGNARPTLYQYIVAAGFIKLLLLLLLRSSMFNEHAIHRERVVSTSSRYALSPNVGRWVFCLGFPFHSTVRWKCVCACLMRTQKMRVKSELVS